MSEQLPNEQVSSPKPQELLAFLNQLVALKEVIEKQQEESIKEEIIPPHTPSSPSVPKQTVTTVTNELPEIEAANKFFSFEKDVRQLDAELLNFANDLRPLGSSTGLISSSFQLRARLQQILHLFRENASDIFPTRVCKMPAEPLKEFSWRKPRKADKAVITKKEVKTAVTNPAMVLTATTGAISQLTSDLEDLPQQFEDLANDLATFLRFLNDIPEFMDDKMTDIILNAQADFMYWASCLGEFRGKFKTLAIQKYVNDLTAELEEHLRTIEEALRLFRQNGISYIKTAQTQAQSGFQNLSTVATFFSAMTASILQFSWNSHGVLSDVVNGMWIGSLVLSVASAINSQLVYQWRAAMYRSPTTSLPWLVSLWLTRMPFIFLILSVLSFSTGLIIWVFSSQQAYAVTLFTAVIASLSLFAFPIAFLFWIAFERWAFNNYKGTMWFSDIVRDTAKDLRGVISIGSLKSRKSRLGGWMKEKFNNARSRCRNTLSKVGGTREEERNTARPTNSSRAASTLRLGDLETGKHQDSPADDDEQKARPASPEEIDLEEGVIAPIKSARFADARSVGGKSAVTDDTVVEKSVLFGPTPSRRPTSSSVTPASRKSSMASDITAVLASGKQKFKEIASNIVMLNRVKQRLSSSHDDNYRPQTAISAFHNRTYFNRRDLFEGGVLQTVRPSSFAVLMPALRNLTPIEPLTDHIALVTCLEYSPHGNYLASGSWDGHAIIWKVEGATYSKHIDIAHKAIIGKVAWSPDGSYLITKTKKVIKVWRAEDGTLVNDLPMKEARAVTWLPHPFTENFAIVERDQVRVMNIDGSEEATHTFERMAIHDVAFTPDAERMILVATLELSPTGLKSSKSRAEKLIIAYSMVHKRIEDQMPILGNVREVAVSRDGKHALVSYETTTPPEVWQIRSEGSTAKLELHHACVPASQVRFEGPSYFGGSRDQFVFSASRNGEIHIWDRESGLLLHTIQAMQGTGEEGGYLSAMAWNRANPDVFMVAAALHDGDIRVWTAPAPPARA